MGEWKNWFGRMEVASGKAMFDDGMVSGPEFLDKDVRKYVVSREHSKNVVYILADQHGEPVDYMTPNDEHHGEISAAMWANDSFNADDRSKPLTDPSSLPSLLLASEGFDPRYEYERKHDEDNHSCYKEVIDRFVQDLLDSTSDPYVILDSIDRAIESFYTFNQFDARHGARLLMKSKKLLKDAIDGIRPSDFSKILCESDRMHSRLWLVDDPKAIGGTKAYMAFSDLSSKAILNPQDSAVLEKLYPCVDLEQYASNQTDMCSYYEMERLVNRELERGHHDLAVLISGHFEDADDLEEHYTEAGRTLLKLGVRDDNEYLISGFLAEPNEKRLMDVELAHPDIDMQKLMSESLYSDDANGRLYLFCLRNGLKDQVCDILSASDSPMHRLSSEETESAFSIAEALYDLEEHMMAQTMTMELLACCSDRLEDYGEELVHLLLQMEMTDLAPRTIGLLDEFRKQRKNKVFITMYKSAGGSLFSP